MRATSAKYEWTIKMKEDPLKLLLRLQLWMIWVSPSHMKLWSGWRALYIKNLLPPPKCPKLPLRSTLWAEWPDDKNQKFWTTVQWLWLLCVKPPHPSLWIHFFFLLFLSLFPIMTTLTNGVFRPTIGRQGREGEGRVRHNHNRIPYFCVRYSLPLQVVWVLLYFDGARHIIGSYLGYHQCGNVLMVPIITVCLLQGSADRVPPVGISWLCLLQGFSWQRVFRSQTLTICHLQASADRKVHCKQSYLN